MPSPLACWASCASVLHCPWPQGRWDAVWASTAPCALGWDVAGCRGITGRVCWCHLAGVEAKEACWPVCLESLACPRLLHASPTPPQDLPLLPKLPHPCTSRARAAPAGRQPAASVGPVPAASRRLSAGLPACSWAPSAGQRGPVRPLAWEQPEYSCSGARQAQEIAASRGAARGPWPPLTSL